MVDAGSMALAGFIDTHSHASGGIAEHPDALATVSRGITTVVSGQDGGSWHPLSRTSTPDRSWAAVINVAMYAGHGTIRDAVLKDFKRVATPPKSRRCA
ncbi:MAG: hypothetical protein U0132_22345 [Gemmatimonadaceae bacterium]